MGWGQISGKGDFQSLLGPDECRGLSQSPHPTGSITWEAGYPVLKQSGFGLISGAQLLT